MLSRAYSVADGVVPAARLSRVGGLDARGRRGAIASRNAGLHGTVLLFPCLAFQLGSGVAFRCARLGCNALVLNQLRNKEQKELAASAATKSELDQMKPKEIESSSAAPACSASRWKDLVLVQMLMEVRNVVKKPNLRLWSLWWVFNSTGYYLVLFYVHILWNKVYPATENKNVYNGGVEAASTLLSETFLELQNLESY